MDWSIMGDQSSSLCPPAGVSLTLRGHLIGPRCSEEEELLHVGSEVTCSRLKVIGPRCSEEELLHGSHVDLNVELSNASLCEDVVRLAEDPAGVGVWGHQQL